MSARESQINDLLDQIKAAVHNARNEWHAHGESGALRGFVDMLESVVTGLNHLLAEVRLTTEEEAKSAKVLALKQRIEASSKETVARSKELTELLKSAKAGR